MSPSRQRPPRRRSRLAVDLGGSLALVGRMLKYLSTAVLFPTVFAVGYGEPVWPFLGAGAIGIAAGLALQRFGDPDTIGAREGYLVVSLMWLAAATLGALPYLLSGEAQLDRPLDAFFEAMSGFTTTGASVLTDIEALNHSLAMWRQFTQWLGGMGIVVLALAVLPRLRIGGRQLLENEMPGPEIDQLSERIRSMAQRLWLLYVGLTVAMVAALVLVWLAGWDDAMTPYEALAHALTTLPTGGFSTQGRSIEGFAPASQWVITVFMVVAGANFALWYRTLVRRDWWAAPRDEELRLYLLALAFFSAIVAAELWSEGLASAGEGSVRHAVFQVVSLMTTTGYASLDFNTWTQLSLMVLVLVMLIGGCAGSTGGSIKVVRHLLLAKVLRRELRQTVHPEEIVPVKLNRSVVDERTLRAAVAFILLYVGAFVVGAGIIALEAAFQGPELSALDAIAASATAIGNVGPAFGVAGPMGSYEPYGDLSTATMVALMWLGRLEVIPIVVLFTRRYWRA